jgi:nucleoside-diphosphate-sugar epimerase
MANIAQLRDHAEFRFIQADVTQDLDAEHLGAGPIDAIFHLASPASPPLYLAHPFETLAAGSEGTRRLLELCQRHRARFVMASTSEIYGEPLVHPQPESYRGNVDPVGPRSVYDEAKRFAEAMTMAASRTRGLDVAIARIFNTYGPRLGAGDGRVVSNFIVRALEKQPLSIYGDGSQTRSFCYVDDEIKGLVALLDSNVTGPINIGNPDERTVAELADLVLEITKSSSAIEFAELPVDDPTRRCPDITMARQLLGWEPEVGIKEGITRTVDYFSALRDGDLEADAKSWDHDTHA